jgi:predicted  nucleic acid-binding Zn-ribbon protein
MKDGRRASDQTIDIRTEFRQFTAQHEVLSRQTGALEAQLDRVENLIHAKRLEDEVGRATAQRIDRRFHVSKGRDQNDVAGIATAAEFMKPFGSGFPWQGNIEDDQIKM